MILVLTVGSGTAGRHSDLRQGLVNTIAATKPRPRGFFLLPSQAEDSVATAELVGALLADLIDSASCLAAWRQPEESLARLYRAAEQAAKIALARHGVTPPYRVEDMIAFLPKERARFQAIARDGHTHLGLRVAWDLLKATEDSLASWQAENRDLFRILETRNQTLYGHGSQTTSLGEVKRCCATLEQGLSKFDLIPRNGGPTRQQALQEAMGTPFRC